MSFVTETGVAARPQKTQRSPGSGSVRRTTGNGLFRWSGCTETTPVSGSRRISSVFVSMNRTVLAVAYRCNPVTGRVRRPSHPIVYTGVAVSRRSQATVRSRLVETRAAVRRGLERQRSATTANQPDRDGGLRLSRRRRARWRRYGVSRLTDVPQLMNRSLVLLQVKSAVNWLSVHVWLIIPEAKATLLPTTWAAE